MKSRTLTGFAAAAATVAVLVPATAGADPQATAAGEEVVSFVTKGKIKAGKTITYQFVCGVTCNVKVDVVLTGLPGKNFSPPAVNGTGFPAGQVLEDKLKPNGPLLQAIKANKKSVKLQSTITATNAATGEVDVDKRTFKFK